MTIRVPTYPNPYYKSTISLDGASYLYRIHWNIYTSKWYMGLKGLSNNVDIANCDMALLTGKDLLAHRGWGGQLGELWVIDQSDGNEDPNYDDMGTRWTLEYTPKT